VIVDCAIYEQGKRLDGEVDLEHAYDRRRVEDTFVWIGLYQPTAPLVDPIEKLVAGHFEQVTKEIGHPSERRTCAASRPGSQSSPSRRPWPASTG
jgi:hypothetical protein